MAEDIAILYAPGVSLQIRNSLICKLNNVLEQLNIGKPEIFVNPEFPIDILMDIKKKKLLTMVIGWGLKDRPSWEKIIPEPKHFGSIRQLFAIDLFERKGFDGRTLVRPMMNAGKYWSQKMQQHRRNLFFSDYFLHPSAPYGLKKVQVPNADNDYHPPNMPLFIYKPGEPAEVEIVRMIFELFVGHDYNFSKICNLLNSREVSAPKKSKVWHPRTIKTILKCPLYIGANKFHDFLKYDVFQSIIAKPVFFEAQAKISQMDIISCKSKLRVKE